MMREVIKEKKLGHNSLARGTKYVKVFKRLDSARSRATARKCYYSEAAGHRTPPFTPAKAGLILSCFYAKANKMRPKLKERAAVANRDYNGRTKKRTTKWLTGSIKGIFPAHKFSLRQDASKWQQNKNR